MPQDGTLKVKVDTSTWKYAGLTNPTGGTLNVLSGGNIDPLLLNPDGYSFRSTFLTRDLLLVWWSAAANEHTAVTDNSVYGVLIDTSTGAPQIASGLLTVGVADPGAEGWDNPALTHIGFGDDMVAYQVPGGGWVLTVTQVFYSGDGSTHLYAVWLLDAGGNLTSNQLTTGRTFSVGGRVFLYNYYTTDDVNLWTRLQLWDEGPIVGGALPALTTYPGGAGYDYDWLVGSGDWGVGTPIRSSTSAAGPGWALIFQNRQRSGMPDVLSCLSLRFDTAGIITHNTLVVPGPDSPTVHGPWNPPLSDYVVGAVASTAYSWEATASGVTETPATITTANTPSAWGPAEVPLITDPGYAIKVGGSTHPIGFTDPGEPEYRSLNCTNGWDQVAGFGYVEDVDYNLVAVQVLLISYDLSAAQKHYLTITGGGGIPGGFSWHTCDNDEPPPPGGTAGDGGVEAGWAHVSWMRSKSGGPGSGRTGRMKVRVAPPG